MQLRGAEHRIRIPSRAWFEVITSVGEFFDFLNNCRFWILGFHFIKELVGSGYFSFCNFKN
jgi:hypothetical protein